MSLIAAVKEYRTLTKTDETNDEVIFAKVDGYPVEIVEPTTTINDLEMMRRDHLYACTKIGLDRKQQEIQVVDVRCASNH